MAAQDFDATTTPQDVVSVLSLEAGKEYAIQNLSGRATLYFRSAPTAPDMSARAFEVSPKQVGYINGDEPTWVWTDSAFGSQAIVDETA